MGNFSLGEAVLGTKVDLTGLGQGLSQAENKTRGAVGALGGFLGTALGTVTGIIGGQILNGVGGALNSVKDAMIGGNAEFERYNVQFGVLLGSADAAQARIDELAQFGARTPFELPEVVRADKVLQAFGLHAEDAKDRFGFAGTEIRTIAGDVAAGTGASFEEISTYLGKFASGATGEAISRMQELGIVTRQQLSDMGLEFSKSGQLMSPIDESMQVLLTAMQDKFGGMMDAQSGTFEGMMSNLQDWMGQAGRIIGQPLFEILKEKLGALLAFLGSDTVKNALTFFAEEIGTNLSVVIDGITNLINGDLGQALNGLMTTSWFEPFINSLGYTYEDFYAFTLNLQRDFENLQQLIGALFSALSGGDIQPFADMLSKFGLMEPLQGIITDLVAAFQVLGQVIGSGSMQPLADFLSEVGFDTPALQGLGQAIVDLGTAAGNAWTQISAAFSQIGSQTTVTFPSIQEIIVGVVTVVVWWLTAIVNHITTFVIPTFVAIVQWVAENWPQIQATAAQVFSQVQAIVAAVVDFILTVVIPAVQQLVDWIVTNWPQIQATALAIFSQVQATVQSRIDAVNDIITSVLGAIQTFWDTWGGTIKAIVDTVFTNIKNLWNVFSAAFKGDWYTFGQNLRTYMDEAWEGVKTVFSNAIEGLKKSFQTMWTNLTTATTDAMDGIKNLDWGALGKAALDGIVAGVKANVQGLIDAVVGAARAAIDAVRGFLDAHSPSEKTRFEIGQPFGQGIVRGILDLVPGIREAGSVAGQMAVASASSSVTNSTSFSATYAYRDEVSLMDDVRFYDTVRGLA